MKSLLIAILLLAPARALAACGEYTLCNSALDYYVPQNLLRLADEAEEARRAKFLRNLRCWNTSDDKFGRVTCEVDGKEVVWEDERQDFYNPDPIVIFVPADGVQEFGKLDGASH